MIQKRTIPIKDVIFTKENIVGIANCIACQGNAKTIRYTIKFFNNHEIESDNISIFDDIKFKEYEIEDIFMYFEDKEYTKKIYVFIYNYSEKGCQIDISYENEENMDWLNITEKKLEEQLSYCNKRNIITSKMRNDTILFFVINFLNVFVAIFLGRVVSKIFMLDDKSLSNCILLSFSILEFFSLCWRNLYYKAFPSIEIDILEKNNHARKARNLTKIIILTFILPFILDVIFNIIEGFMGLTN